MVRRQTLEYCLLYSVITIECDRNVAASYLDSPFFVQCVLLYVRKVEGGGKEYVGGVVEESCVVLSGLPGFIDETIERERKIRKGGREGERGEREKERERKIEKRKRGKEARSRAGFVATPKPGCGWCWCWCCCCCCCSLLGETSRKLYTHTLAVCPLTRIRIPIQIFAHTPAETPIHYAQTRSPARTRLPLKGATRGAHARTLTHTFARPGKCR